MFGVTAGGPGLVAVGRDGPVADGEGDAAVWTSLDGFTWSRVPHDEDVFGGQGEQRIVSVTAGGSGLVAVGFDRPAEQGEGNAVVWTSPDGFTWSRVPHDEDVFATSGEQYPAGAHEERMLSVTAGGPGLVAAGFDSVDDCGWDSAVWTSPDGLTWSRVPDERACFTTHYGVYDRMLSVTVGPAGLAAVGEEHHPGAAAVWND
jgi:hypothetical protein